MQVRLYVHSTKHTGKSMRSICAQGCGRSCASSDVAPTHELAPDYVLQGCIQCATLAAQHPRSRAYTQRTLRPVWTRPQTRPSRGTFTHMLVCPRNLFIHSVSSQEPLPGDASCDTDSSRSVKKTEILTNCDQGREKHA